MRPPEATPRDPKRLLALERANAIRRARADLKRQIGSGLLCATQVILDPPVEASSWPLAELLRTQPGWGDVRVRDFLSSTGISETRQMGQLTERQRRLLAEELEWRSPGHARSEPTAPRSASR